MGSSSAHARGLAGVADDLCGRRWRRRCHRLRHNQDGTWCQTEDTLRRTPKQKLLDVWHATVHRHDDQIDIEIVRQLHDLQKRCPCNNHGFYRHVVLCKTGHEVGVVRLRCSGIMVKRYSVLRCRRSTWASRSTTAPCGSLPRRRRQKLYHPQSVGGSRVSTGRTMRMS